MVKICLEEYPLGSFPRQQTPGFYMDGNLKDNIEILAKKIVKDMQFVGICCSSTFGVRTGKSTCLQQVAKFFTNEVNELHGLNNTFTINNIVFNSEDLQKRAFHLPLYSVLILDEGDDLTAAHWSRIAKNLKRFFRKCGQLNLFILLILPDFFEIPKTYAISRSNFLLNVKFEGEFERGYFEFYSFNQKKKLYIKGKKYNDYSVVKPSFYGRFPKLYCVNEKEYRKAKYLDMLSDDPENKPQITELDTKIKYFNMVYNYFKGKIAAKEIGLAFGVSENTAFRYISKERPQNQAYTDSNPPKPTDMYNKPTNTHKSEENFGSQPLIKQNPIISSHLEPIKAQGIETRH